MEIDEDGNWFCIVVSQGPVHVNLDMPTLVSRWHGAAYEGDTIVNPYVVGTKSSPFDKRQLNNTKQTGEEFKIDVAKSERVSRQ